MYGEWFYFSRTFTWSTLSAADTHVNIYGGASDGLLSYAKLIKLEKGNKATDWTPAPEDQVSDWSITDEASFSYIKNKPTKLTDFANNNTYALQTTSVTAGNGLTGGGTLASTRTITLGTPSTLTATSTNTVGTTNHSHAITTTSVGAANTIVQTNASGSIISSKGAGFQNAAYAAGFNPI